MRRLIPSLIATTVFSSATLYLSHSANAYPKQWSELSPAEKEYIELVSSRAYFQLGKLAVAKAEFEQAKQLYPQKRAISEDEQKAIATGLHATYLHLASYELPNGRVPVFTLAPDSNERDIRVIATLFLKANHYDKAEEITTYAMLKYPNLAALYFQRAVAGYELGRIEQARADFEEAQRRYSEMIESASTEDERIEAQNVLEEIKGYLTEYQFQAEGEASEI